MKSVFPMPWTLNGTVNVLRNLAIVVFIGALIVVLMSSPVQAQESTSEANPGNESGFDIEEDTSENIPDRPVPEERPSPVLSENLELPAEESAGLLESEPTSLFEMAPMMEMPMQAQAQVCTPRGGSGEAAPTAVSFREVVPSGNLKRVYLDLPQDPFALQSVQVTIPGDTFSNANAFVYLNGRLNGQEVRSNTYGLNVTRSSGNRVLTITASPGPLQIRSGTLIFAVNTANTNYAAWNIIVNGTPVGEASTTDPRQGVEFEASANMVARKAPRTPTATELESTTVFVAAGQGRTSLHRQVFGTNEFVRIGEQSRWQYNAISYNNVDHWIYGISQTLSPANPCYPGGHLLQINPATGEVHNLGPVVSPGTENSAFVGENQLINSGVFEPSNSVLRVANASTSGTRQTYQVQLPNVGVLSMPTAQVRASDYMYAEDHVAGLGTNSRYAWGIVSPAPMRNNLVPGYTNPDNTVVIERIDMVTNVKTYFNVTNLRSATGQQIPRARTWGKAWAYGNGNFGFGTGGETADQLGVQLRIENQGSANPTFTSVNSQSGLPASYNTDGTSNAGVPPQASDLEAVKFQVTPAQHPDIIEALRSTNAYDPSRIYWGVRVTNKGPGRSSGYTLYDHMPSDYQNQRVHLAAAGDYVVGGMQTVGTKGGPSGTYVFGPLANGETRQIVVSAARSGANSQCGPNTVEIVNNENDPIQSNNQAEVPTNCAVEVDKSSVGNVRVDGAGTYTATYDITVSGFGNYAEVIDRPTLPAGAVMNEVSVIFVNEAGQQRAKRVLASRPDGSYKLDENSAQRTLSGSGSGVHVYKVEMKFTIDPAQWHEAYGDVQNGDCKTRGGIGNAVTVGQSTDEVCDDVPPPSLPDPTLKIIKMGPDGNPLPLEGVRFAVNRPDGSHVTDLEIDGAYLTATLEYDEEYVLVELQSPTGYSLLGKEIPFRILMENGRAVVQVEGAPIEISVLPATSESPFEPVVEVVNVYKGELPLTGGSGWYRLGLIGLLLAGAAVLAATRSAQKN